VSRRGVQVALGDDVLKQINQNSAGIGTGMKVNHIVGATELKERLRLKNKEQKQWKHI